MIDFFGRKARAETERLRKEAELAQSQFLHEHDRVMLLLATIRDIDQQIFKMSQCSSWEQMRPNFNTLQKGMEARMTIESQRIGHVIRKELARP